ncbi:MAG: CPXCG motif-containing cysteine-rich protein [Xanthomonadales bacterium]|nr:CPXCG motif-containing cysteine-rich protein [Gammaproteobacteria bacterium]MBT8053407.1 CPXCG motif-containing cysteine-rich protein [Gammaproteobacteria bacterium]NND57446.1 CPXCG motif-containing cysteine-rich protein [Xanthomonadales bacterium]NNK52092.1 CPXCG motif-containing cysteine-rich protein [Xanthomonadales bacterium]
MLQETDICCPYCGEIITLLIEPAEQDQQYTEDCQVCCQPIVILTRLLSGGETTVEARREDDA